MHQIKFSGFDLPKPIFTLDEINFPDYIIEELRMQGITRPTAIQSMTWPALYSGRDLMCIGLPTHSRVISVNEQKLNYLILIFEYLLNQIVYLSSLSIC